ncbi:hypothetical protein ACRTD2_20990, partial [Vibrio alginolyticus]
GFYTDCLGQKRWSVPSQVIDKEAAKNILRIARTLCEHRTYTQTHQTCVEFFNARNATSFKSMVQ